MSTTLRLILRHKRCLKKLVRLVNLKNRIVLLETFRSGLQHHRVPEQAFALVDGKRIHLTQGAKGEAKNAVKLQQNKENNSAPSHRKASDIHEQLSVAIQSEPLLTPKTGNS